VPAGNDQRRVIGAVGRANGQPGKVEDVEHVGVKALVGQRERQDVELRQGQVRLQAHERVAGRAEPFLVVRPGGEDPFARRVLPRVQDVVEDPQAQVRHADLIGVGKEKADLCPHRGEVLVHRVDLGVDVPRRLGDEREKIFEHGTPLNA
jgi:hypothetical protein